MDKFNDFSENAKKESSYSVASGKDYHYVVLQVTLKEKLIGPGSGNLTELEDAINRQAKKRIQTAYYFDGKRRKQGFCRRRPHTGYPCV